MKKGPRALSYLIVLIFLFFTACTSDSSPKEANRNPKNAISGLEIAEDLEVQLFASEPMVVNPTNIDIDPLGRVWVTEGVNYRMHLNPGNPENPKGDRIVILSDEDGDGKADQAKEFVRDPEINAALGICVLGNEVIVSCSPNILKFTDLDGDDIADKKDTLFSGIGGFQHDHGAHAFTFGPDGKLYFNFGNSGTQLLDKNGNVIIDQLGRPIKADGKPYHQGMVFRCDPDGSNVEVLAHNFRNNYEVAVDAFGTMWQSDNDDDGNRGVRINYVMPFGNFGYKDELTGAGWRNYRTGMSDEIPLRHWHQNDPGVVPNLLQTGAGSPCGMIVYEGALLPERFRNQMIHCDAGPNVVRAYPTKPMGAGYSASITPLAKAETDQWFRPVDVCAAPDGSLMVADWYDPGVGGHKVGDLNKGRIFRIVPKGMKEYRIPSFQWDDLSSVTDALKNPNLAIRHKAYNLLRKNENASEKYLQELYHSSDPRLKARALWLLAQIPVIGDSYLQAGLKDEDENIRITAFRAIQSYQAEQTISTVRKMIEDPSPAVQRELALSNHLHFDGQNWARIAQKFDGKDRWLLEALGIGAANEMEKALAAYLLATKGKWKTEAGKQIVWRLRSSKTIPMLSSLLLDDQTPHEEKLKYFRALDFQNSSLKDPVFIRIAQKYLSTAPETRNTALTHLSPSFVQKSPKAQKLLSRILPEIQLSPSYLQIVENLKLNDQKEGLVTAILQQKDNSLKAKATRLLLELNGTEEIEQFLQQEDGPEKWGIIEALSFANTDQALQLIEGIIFDQQQSTGSRKAAIQAMGQGWKGEHRLMSLLEEGKIEQEMAIVAANRLTSAIDGSLRLKALEYLGENESEIPPLNEILAITGDPAKGAIVFKKNCSICHKINEEGINFGPDLSLIGDKLSPEAILSSILYPGEGINFGYEGYIIKLKDGDVFSGFIESKTEDQLSIRMNGGISRTISLNQVKDQQMLEQSLMPAGFHQNLSKQELSDLVSYLSSLKVVNPLAIK